MSRADVAKEVFEIEAQAIKGLIEQLDESFDLAVDLVLSTKGKVVVSGIGKSGIIGKKFAATLSSTGTPAFFLHPSEGSHGDFGVVSSEDIVIGLSYGGSSSEMNPLFSYIKRKGIKLIGITGNSESPLAKNSDAVINVSVKKEACPLNLAPTASSTATLAMCDALSMVLLDEKGFKKEDFAQVHPGGSLGRRLLTRVSDVLNKAAQAPFVNLEEDILSVVDVMTTRDVKGVCGVLDHDQKLVGVITDGDVRRWFRSQLQSGGKLSNPPAKDLMSHNPKCIYVDELAQKALYLMEDFSISSLFVLDSKMKSKPLGVLHIQDLLDAKIT